MFLLASTRKHIWYLGPLAFLHAFCILVSFSSTRCLPSITRRVFLITGVAVTATEVEAMEEATEDS